MWGNSTCQWKKRYWRVRSATCCSAAARFRELSSAAKFSITWWVIAVERVTSVFGWTKAAHQASARSFWMRRSALTRPAPRPGVAGGCAGLPGSPGGCGRSCRRAWPGRRCLPGCRTGRTGRAGPRRSAAFCFFRAETTLRSSPSMGVKASSGRPLASRAGVTPSRELPTRMFWSRYVSGLPGSRASIQSEIFASSTDIGLMSTP